jgi:uncharacterized protein
MDRRYCLLLVGLVLVAAVVFVVLETDSDESKTVCFDWKCFQVKIADNDEERMRGLMFVESLPEKSGMLFVFEDVGKHPFWMKNTLIDLDIVWIDEDFRVVEIVSAVSCVSFECESYGEKKTAKYVLEINYGLTKEMGVEVGDEVRID